MGTHAHTHSPHACEHAYSCAHTHMKMKAKPRLEAMGRHAVAKLNGAVSVEAPDSLETVLVFGLVRAWAG